jgi:hypothetical protein
MLSIHFGVCKLIINAICLQKINAHNIMMELIITTKEELTEIVRKAVSLAVIQSEKSKPQVETLDMDGMLKLLAEHGYKTSKAQIYKFTSLKLIPYMKLGSKLLFSRKEILEWLKNTSIRSKTRDDALSIIQSSLRKG